MLASSLLLACTSAGTTATAPALLLEGTVATMDDAHTVVPNGNVLVRNGLIVAVWSGGTPPAGVDTRGARVVRATYVFPGLIDLHDHPSYDALPLWTPPSSHAQPTVGRPTGREPYDNRYQWNAAPPPEFTRLVVQPHAKLNVRDVLVHAEVRAALAGVTALEGESTGILIRAVEGTNFGRARIEARVADVTSPLYAAPLAQRMANGEVDAWLVHLAEGVRDGDRAPGDPFSSRHELDEIRSLGLLTRATVVLHGVALERADFATLAAAGAKLVWSPLSNLLLYGRTAHVYDALAAGVNVSLGTDWTPTGSNTLLDELKVASVTLRDPRLLGGERTEDDAALDRELADMVTRNPAHALGWSEVGSIETGKHADLLLLRSTRRTTAYRALVAATQRDVRLVIVDGKPVAGDVDALRAAGATAIQQLHRFGKGVVLRGASVARAETRIRAVLHDERPAPLFSADDHTLFDFLHGTRAPYPSNRNWIRGAGNAFARLAHG